MSATAAARDLRRARNAARRERQSLGDALYVIYVSALVAVFPLSALAQSAVPGEGPTRSAYAAVEPLALLTAALVLLVARASAAVRGGPVVLPPEDARMLLTWPVPRRTLLLPALAAAMSRAVGGALLVTAGLLYVDVRQLGSTATSVVRDDLLLPPLLSAVALLLAWLVQSSRAAAAVARVVGGVVGLAAVVALCWAAVQISGDGFTGGLQDIADAGPDSSSLPFSGATNGVASGSGLVVAAVLVVLLVPLVLLSLRATNRVTPEQLLSRSRRADATKTGLKLGFTASVYLTRTEPLRRARRRRKPLPITQSSAQRGVVGKAFLQEQGTPLLPRLLACASVSGAVLAAASHVTPGHNAAPTALWSLGAAGALTVIATRCADPIRLDVDRAPFSAAIPLPHALIARLDILTSAAVTFVGTLLGAVGALVLGVAPGAQAADVILGAAALALLLSAAGALGALSDDPSPFIPPQVAIGYRTSGLIAVVVGVLASGISLRFLAKSDPVPMHAPDRLPMAAFILAIAGIIALLVATFRAKTALTRGR